MNSLTRLCTQGRCCGLSKVQKLMLTGFLVWANARRANGADTAVPRPATPMPRTTSRRVGFPIADLFIASSPNMRFDLSSNLPDFLSCIVPGSHTHRQRFVSSYTRSVLGFGYIPPSAAIAESFPPAVGDGNRILEFDEAALRMQDCGLDRDHHPALKRTIRIGGRIGHRTLAGEMGSLVAHKAHSMGHKIKMRQLL